MGRSGPIDPVMAARLAAQAAAQAAADAAAAAEAGADGTRLADAAATTPFEQAASTLAQTGTPTLAPQRPTVAGDGVAGVVQGDGSQQAGAAPDLTTLTTAVERESLLDLPDLSSAGRTGAGLDAAAVGLDTTSAFDSQQGPMIGKDAIGTVFRVNIEKDQATLVRTQPAKPAEDEWVRWTTKKDGTGSDASATGGSATGGSSTGGSSSGGSSSGGSSSGGSSGGQEPNPSPLVFDPPTSGSGPKPAPSADPPATPPDATNPPPATDPPPAGDPPAGEGDVIEVNNSNGASSGTSVAMPVPDLDGQGGYNTTGMGGVLTGVTGHLGSSIGGRLGPQGGDTTVNPGTEGGGISSSGGRRGPLTGGEVYLVGQPVPLDNETTLDPVALERVTIGPGPEVINPGDGSQANADAQASTAYHAEPDTAVQADGHETHVDPMGGNGMDDPTGAMAPLDESLLPDADHGREFGQAHGQAGQHGGALGHGGHGTSGEAGEHGLGDMSD